MKTIDGFTPGELLTKNDVVHIYIRGETFRSNYSDQIYCLNSMVDKIIKPLKNVGLRIKVTFVVYLNYRNKKLINHLSTFSKIIDDIKLIEVDKKVVKTQGCNFIFTVKEAAKNGENTLIIRPDLYFKKEIPLTRLNSDKYLFQWNYFHNYLIKEVPDQLHWVGKNRIVEFYNIISENENEIGVLPNGLGQNTLHNLYNFIIKSKVSVSDIGYIFEFKLSELDFDNEICKLRGNPDVSLLNNIYSYKRKLSLFMRLRITLFKINENILIFKRNKNEQ